MDLSVTAVTKNRQFSKALTRLAPQLQTLKDALKVVPTKNFPYSCIMLTHMDLPFGHVKPIPNRDGIFHIEVGYDNNLKLTFQDRDQNDLLLLANIADNISAALNIAPLAPEDKKVVIGIVDTWKNRTTT